MNRVLKNIAVALAFCSVVGYNLPLNTYAHFNSQEEKAPAHFLEQDEKYKDNKQYLGKYKITAYDLSYQSCAKSPDHPAYGITASGKSLKNHSRETAMAIAVDPKQIPLGSDVLIVFSGSRSKYTGIYKAVDTGSAIKNNRIDIFFGDHKENVSDEAINFGVSSADVYILNQA